MNHHAWAQSVCDMPDCAHTLLRLRSCLLPALSLLFLFLTACIDPGIIPRQEPDQEYLEGRKPRCAVHSGGGGRILASVHACVCRIMGKGSGAGLSRAV